MTLASTEEERFNTARAVQLAVVAALGGFMFGFDTAVINGTVTAMREDFAMSLGADRASSSPRRCSAPHSAPGGLAASATATDASG